MENAHRCERAPTQGFDNSIMSGKVSQICSLSQMKNIRCLPLPPMHDHLGCETHLYVFDQLNTVVVVVKAEVAR